jgi:hypothetical protein
MRRIARRRRGPGDRGSILYRKGVDNSLPFKSTSARRTLLPGVAIMTLMTLTLLAACTPADRNQQAQHSPSGTPSAIVVSKGSGPYHPAGCSSPSCAHIYVTFANFGANQKLTMTFWTDNCNGSGAWGTYTITTNGSGAWSGDTPYAFGCSGRHVWVTAGGYESNHYTWP